MQDALTPEQKEIALQARRERTPRTLTCSWTGS